MKVKKKRKIAPIIILIIAVLFIIFKIVSSILAANTPAVVTTTVPFRGDLQESINTSGNISSEEQKTYFAPITGRIGEISIQKGDTVKTGDVLINYDEEQLEKALKEARLQQTSTDSTLQSTLANNSKSQSKLNEATTNLPVLNQQIADHEAYLEDLQDKLEKNQRDTSNGLSDESFNLNTTSANLQKELAQLVPGSSEYQDKMAEIEKITAQINRNSYLQQIASSSDYTVKMQKEISDVTKQLAEFKEYKAEMEGQKSSSENTVLDSYQKNKLSADSEMSALQFETMESDYYTGKKGVVAEFDGIVVDCTAVEGSTVTSGMQLLTVASSNELKVTFSASKYDLEKLEVGQSVLIKAVGNEYEGKISRINRVAEMNVSGTPMVNVEVHINNPDDKIIIGLDAKIEVNTHKVENAILVPVEAINADFSGDFLYVVENGIVVRKPIVCGISSDTYIEIIEGIEETDQVILSAYTNLVEGMSAVAMPAAAMPDPANEANARIVVE